MYFDPAIASLEIYPKGGRKKISKVYIKMYVGGESLQRY